MDKRTRLAGRWLRLICLFASILGCAADVALVLGHRALLPRLGVPLPIDEHLFVLDTALAFTFGVAAILAVRQRREPEPLIAVAVLGKWLFATITCVFLALGRAAPYFYLADVFHALLTLVLLLYWVQAKGDDLFALQLDVFEGIANEARAPHKRALLVRLAGREPSPGLARIRVGLEKGGYEVDQADVVPQERLFYGAPSFGAAFWIVLRALGRTPTRVAPLQLPADRDWDLVVVESPDWVSGVAAPIEAMLVDPANRRIFEGRDAAAIVVERGSRRRALAMIVSLLERAGANVVAARAFADRASARAALPRLVGSPVYTLSEPAGLEAESLGASLAARARTRPHWTLLLEDKFRG